MSLMALITVIATLVAVTMTAVVLRMAWNERQRSAARVATLAADIHAGRTFESVPPDDEPAVAMREMFSPVEKTRRQWIAGVGAFGLGIVAAIMLVLTVGNEEPAIQHQGSPDSQTFSPATPQPLELLALDHEQTNNRLTVHGVVRNPAHAPELDHLTAVVLLFNQQGGFLTSGRAAVETSALEPGAEATFVVTLPGGSDVGRYRVSFRTDDKVVPHVDRRQSEPATRAEVKS